MNIIPILLHDLRNRRRTTQADAWRSGLVQQQIRNLIMTLGFRMKAWLAVPVAFSLFSFCGLSLAQTSNLVHEDVNGVLQYGTYANEGETNSVNKVPDFSNCGYKGGGEPIPFVPVVVTINAPTGGDDTALIQNAIDTVAGGSLNASGFRGAVLIKAGNYKVSSTLNITTSGVVIRGESQQASGGTKITMTATVQDNLFYARGSGSPSEVANTRVSITDSFVPTGATSFNVSNASGYSVGDKIRIHYKMNSAWISAIKMDVLTLHPLALPDDVNWTAAEYQLYYERTITAMSGNTITIDAPLVQSIETQYGGADIFKYTFSGQISNVGFEALRLESTYLSNTDELHGWVAIQLVDLRDSWVRQVTAKYFGMSAVSLGGDCHYVTIEDCAMVDPKSITDGGRKYSFNINGSAFVLMQRCYTWGGRHDYVSGARVCGPNVFVDCLAENTFSDVGPHHRYSTGQLYDNIKCGNLHVQNRGVSGTGHGWSGAQIMAWNSVAPQLRCDAPVGAMNWNIGCIGTKYTKEWADPAYPDNFGIWESLGTHVTPRSLYYRQLQERLGRNAVRNVIIPEQDKGTIWTELASWAGEGLFGDDVIAWTSSAFIEPPTNSADLSGRVRNLKMLGRGITSTTWSKLSGPGTVTFGNAAAMNTTATFSTIGGYVIRLTVGDGTTTASCDVNVRYGNNDPVVSAGADQAVTLSGEPWSPAQLTPAVWFDAADASTLYNATTGGSLVTADAGAIARWQDKSGNNRHATQSTSGFRPLLRTNALNGSTVIDFDGTDDLLSVGGTAFSAQNIFAVLNYEGGTSFTAWCWAFGSKGTPDVPALFASSGSTNVGSNLPDKNNPSATRYVNGAVGGNVAALSTFDIVQASGASASPSRSNWLIGDGDANWNGRFAELIVLSDAISTENRQRMEGYLAHKWGTTGSLPSDHPYKTTFGRTATASLQGSATDAENDTLSYAWSVVSGSASAVTFANASAASTTATFSEAGAYTLRLTVSDGLASVSSDCVVTVSAAGGLALSYLGNGSTSGSVPVDANSPYDSGSTVTVLGNTGGLVRTGYSFAGWNTAADGGGSAYVVSNSFTISSNTTLYAQWSSGQAISASSRHFIRGESENVSATIGYISSTGDIIGSSGTTGSREDRNVVFGYTLPTLPAGATLESAVFNFEITQARDSTGGTNLPELHAYLLNTANPTGSGTTFYYHGLLDPNLSAKRVGTTSVSINVNTDVNYTTGEQTRSFTLTGESLELLKSFYNGNTPTQSMAYFRFNLSVDPAVTTYRRYRVSTAADASSLQLTALAPANLAPVWSANQLTKPAATEGVAYLASLASDAADPENNPLTFSKISGPAWLDVAANGALSGTPSNSDTGSGSFTVSVTDGSAAEVPATLNITVQTAFAAWANQSTTFTQDVNVDGLADGLAWLLGAGNPADHANHLLPRAAVDNDNLAASFKVLKAAKRGSAALRLQYSKDLGASGTWTTITVPESSGTVGGVDFAITPNGDLNEVQVTIPASTAGPEGRLFMRLNGVIAEP